MSESELDPKPAPHRESPTQEQGPTQICPPPEESIGTTLGRYKLRERVGEGGWGTVYVAEQTEPVRRQVALKVIKLGMDTREVIARFEAERQALAMMDHPNIAKVLDAGATESGRPYFVMELVRGIRITDYCDQANLSTKERLDLFIKVCQAIQHAHQKGIIHRDIKPSNILVTLHDGVPAPKVIDFGIAKATAGRLTDLTVYTELHQFIGTPAYMSPEQAEMSGLDIDTRSDIYSLGVLLYELLTGKTPFDGLELRALGIDAMRKTIREKEPPRPSTRLATLKGEELTTTAKRRSTDAPKLIHLLKGDLDWIMMKCLEKDRARRYETANGLAADITRHLKNEPVVARPPSTAYRFHKAFRRNKLIFTAATAVTVALVAGIGVSTWQMVRATRAEREQNKLREVAVKALDGEKEQRVQAQTEQRKASESQQQSRRLLYAADMNLAVQALETDNRAHALDLLNRHIPKSGEEDLRGVEWRYLWRQCDVHKSFALPGHSNNVRYVFFSPDGASLASRSMDDVVKVWDLGTRTERCMLTQANALAGFTPDGSNVVVGQKDGLVLFCDARTGRVTRSLQTDGLLVRLLADGRTVATTSTNYAVKFWDVPSGQAKPGVAGKGGVWRMADSESVNVTVSSDGKEALIRLARSSEGWFDLEIWETGSPTRLRSHPKFNNPRSADFSLDGKFAAVGTGPGAVWIWDLKSQEEPRTFMAGDATIWSVAFSPDGRKLATASSDQTVRVFDTLNRTNLLTLRGHENGVQCVAFSPDGTRLASGSRDETIRVWSLENQVTTEVLTNASSGVVFSSAGEVVTANRRNKTVKIWDVATLQEKRTLPLDAHPLGISSDGKSLWLIDDSHFITVDLENASASKTVPIQSGLTNVAYIAFSSDRRLLATRSEKAIRVHECSTGRELALLPAPPGVSEPLAFSPDGTILAISGGDGTIGFWDATQRRSLASIPAHRYFTSGLAFSPDGKWLASGGGDNVIRLWDVATRNLRGTLKGHRQFIYAIGFSPDGKTMASGGSDRRVKFWDVALQQEVGFVNVSTDGDPVWTLAFSPDGNTLAVQHGSIVEFWRAPPLAKIDAIRQAK